MSGTQDTRTDDIAPAADHSLRQEIVAVAQRMAALGLAPNKSGNVSCRTPVGMLVTPSGKPYEALVPTDVVPVDLEGRVLGGVLRPSSETPMHAAIYRARPDAAAIVHTHSPRATALACARRGIPVFHYMIALAGGAEIRCAQYATFGTAQLAANALQALEGRRAALLANHGVVAVGGTLAGAFAAALEVENLAGQYLDLLAAGLAPVTLDEAEMERVKAAFAGYGRPA